MSVSFGAVGMPTWFGLGGLDLTPDELREVAFKTALIHAGAALVIPLLALRVVVSAREVRENLRFIGLVLGVTMAVYVAVARFNVEFPSIAGGVSGLAASVWLARHGIGLAAEESEARVEKIATASLLKATFPLWGTVLILVITRLDALGLRGWLTSSEPALNLPLAAFGELRISPSLVVEWRHIFGTESSWSHAVLYVPSVIPFFLVSALTFALFRTPAEAVGVAWQLSFRQVLRPIGAFSAPWFS